MKKKYPYLFFELVGSVMLIVSYFLYLGYKFSGMKILDASGSILLIAGLIMIALTSVLWVMRIKHKGAIGILLILLGVYLFEITSWDTWILLVPCGVALIFMALANFIVSFVKRKIKKNTDFEKEVRKQNSQRDQLLARFVMEGNEHPILQIARSITSNEKDIMSKLELCVKNPREYYNESNFESCRYCENVDDIGISWLAMVDLLIENNYCCELDYKDELDELMYALQELKSKIDIENSSFDAEGEIYGWCKEINKELVTKSMCVAELSIDSDSYVLFVCEIEKFNYISKLAKKFQLDIHKFEKD